MSEEKDAEPSCQQMFSSAIPLDLKQSKELVLQWTVKQIKQSTDYTAASTAAPND